jgi:hypothetical protein
VSDFAAYCFYVNRPDLMSRALDSFPELWDELTIVDNSADGIPEEASLLRGVFRPPVPLSYSQSCNWMLRDATEKEVDFIIHFHSDAVSTNPKAVKELLAYIRKAKSEGKKHGIWWTFYDILWAINPVALREIGGWNTLFPSYFVDQDLKRRLRLAGWETVDTHIEGMSHEGSATVNSDPQLKLINQQTFPLQAMLYQAMWGGDPEKEMFKYPFNKPALKKLRFW